MKDRAQFIVCDEIAVALALDERIATAAVEATCSVETRGDLTRGQMVSSRSSLDPSAVRVRLITGIDFQRLVQLLTAAVED